MMRHYFYLGKNHDHIFMRFFYIFMLAAIPATAKPVRISEPSHDRWLYPSNSSPGMRTQASTFSALPDDESADDRWGCFLFAFNTNEVIPPGLPASCYRIKFVEVTATIGQDRLFLYDATYDSWASCATPSRPAFPPDTDPGRPLELHGTGFRGGFTAFTFQENSPYGSVTKGERNAYPLGFTTTGSPRDVSNNVHQQFETSPWAIGANGSLTPGEMVPVETTFRFTLNLDLPGVRRYLSESLSAGKVWFTLSSLSPAIQQGGEFVSYYTKESMEHQFFGGFAPSLSIETEIDHPLSITRSGNNIIVSWPEFSGFTYTLETSTELLEETWLPIMTNHATAKGTGKYQATQTSPATGRRFYRLKVSLTPS